MLTASSGIGGRVGPRPDTSRACHCCPSRTNGRGRTQRRISTEGMGDDGVEGGEQRRCRADLEVVRALGRTVTEVIQRKAALHQPTIQPQPHRTTTHVRMRHRSDSGCTRRQRCGRTNVCSPCQGQQERCRELLGWPWPQGEAAQNKARQGEREGECGGKKAPGKDPKREEGRKGEVTGERGKDEQDTDCWTGVWRRR